MTKQHIDIIRKHFKLTCDDEEIRRDYADSLVMVLARTEANIVNWWIRVKLFLAKWFGG